MNDWQVILAASSAIILFLFGIENFSKEIQNVSGDKLRKFLSKHTTNPIKGLLIGGVITSLIQSSTATSVIAVGLVNAGIISFKNSMGIIFGANIGTTMTAQLVAFKLTDIAPYFIISGFLLSIIRMKYSFIGKTLFYFGFVFFSLNIISSTLTPLKDSPELINYLSSLDNFFVRILAGTIFTAIIQSSSVTTGIAVIFVQQGLFNLEQAIPIVMGANIGTTITAALASIGMDNQAKRTALLNTFYNIGGVLIFTPVLLLSMKWINRIEMPPAETLANFHFVFNFCTSIVFLVFIQPLSKMFSNILKNGDELEIKPVEFPPIKAQEDVASGIEKVSHVLDRLVFELKENYFMISISIEAKEEHILNKCKRHHSYMMFLRGEISEYCALLAKSTSNKEEGEKIIALVSRMDYIYQINDSLLNLIELNDEIIQKSITLSLDSILSIREVSTSIVDLFEVLLGRKKEELREPFAEKLKSIHAILAKSYQTLLKVMTMLENEDATPLARFLSYNQRLKDKIHSLTHL